MSKIITINRSGFEKFGRGSSRGSKKGLILNRVVLGMKKREDSGMRSKGYLNLNLKNTIIFLFIVAIFLGCCHLYQINDLATKGYEIKEIENEITELKKVNEKNRIKEVEFRSMYNIEKEVPEMDLVASKEVVYLDINGSVAMK